MSSIIDNCGKNKQWIVLLLKKKNMKNYEVNDFAFDR